MLLKHLVKKIQPLRAERLHDHIRISGISIDSRKVEPGHLFVALPGAQIDGATFARDAWAKGAAAILTERDEPLTALPQLVVRDAREGLARAARAFYDRPDTRLKVGAITGTNGKSTTAYLVRHLLHQIQVPCGLLGTIEYDLGGPHDSAVLPAPLTTPESLDLYRYLRGMADNGCESAIMEVSSHGLCQHRVDGIDFKCGIFTNLTQDHLDYHRTMEQYRDAKAILFRNLSPKSIAVLNFDDAAGRWYAERTHADVLGYTTRGTKGAELRATTVQMDIHGTTFIVESPWGRREVRWPLVGAHNLENALAALGASLVLGTRETQTFSFDAALGALEKFTGVPGRLEPVGDGLAPFRVLVDYAHTDDALRSVMRALRELQPSRLIVVFGCGGDRDRTKRPKMGLAVEELADLGIVTSDNPRTEDPQAILGDIWEGINDQGKFITEVDRAAAIEVAIREARPGDVVLIAGKGHEDYQIIGKEKRPFDDRKMAKAALEKRYSPEPKSAAAAGN